MYTQSGLELTVGLEVESVSMPINPNPNSDSY